MEGNKIFVSYSATDRAWLGRLKVHLATLERPGLVEVWSDAQIEASAHSQKEIDPAHRPPVTPSYPFFQDTNRTSIIAVEDSWSKTSIPNSQTPMRR